MYIFWTVNPRLEAPELVMEPRTSECSPLHHIKKKINKWRTNVEYNTCVLLWQWEIHTVLNFFFLGGGLYFQEICQNQQMVTFLCGFLRVPTLPYSLNPSDTMCRCEGRCWCGAAIASLWDCHPCFLSSIRSHHLPLGNLSSALPVQRYLSVRDILMWQFN